MPSKLSRIEAIALVIGAIGGVLAIPKIAIEGWQTLMSSPKVVAWPSTPLRLKYEPAHRTVSFAFGIVLHNEGNKAEKLRDANAFLAIPNDPARRHDFNITQIIFKEGENLIPLSLPVAKDSFRSFTCEITTPLTEQLIALLQQHESRREFGLILTGENGQQYSVKFRFDLGRDLVTSFFDPKGASTKTVQFIGSNLQ